MDMMGTNPMPYPGGSMSATREPLPAAEHDVSAPDQNLDRVRASDRERQDVVDRLHDALGEGRLDWAESETRVATAYAARFRDEFAALVADLPTPDADAADEAPDWVAIWTSVVWRIRMVLWRGDERGRTPPSAAQCRNAVLLTVATVVWLGVCAVLGAALVAA
jgi:Domain of unknown function (DUF1707)